MLLQNARFIELSEKLGGLNQDHIQSFFYWNNPFELKNWTMNVVEILLIGGAILGLLHAIQWYKKKQDPTNICVWFATIIYVLIIEPLLYFPELFHIDSLFKVIFIHNEFTLGLIFNRTPLYILALYPATIYTSFALVQGLNIFKQRNGLLLGAVAVGFANHCFYEIFDHIGPQYAWWLWDYDLNISKPALGSVPLYSLVGFALNGAMALAYLSKKELIDYVDQGSWTWKVLAWRTFKVGARTPLLLAITTPQLIYTFIAKNPNIEIVTAIYYIQLVLLAAIGIYAFWQCNNDTSAVHETEAPQLQGKLSQFPIYYFGFYLIAFAGLWLYALGDYLSAENGITVMGNPIGSLPYVIISFIACLFILKVAHQKKAQEN